MSAPLVGSDALAGVILAGGRSRRMGGAVKALLPLADRPLLRHVIDRVKPQVDRLLISAGQPSDAFDAFGLSQVVDPRPDGGPLGGLLSALQETGPDHEWLLLVPCDAPFLPADLADRLLACAQSASLPGAMVRYEMEIQPTFSIWNRRVLPPLKHAFLEQGMAGFKQFLAVNELAVLDWPRTEPSPFFNINDQQALLAARRQIDSASRQVTKGPAPCSA